MNTPDWNDLRYFLAVKEAGSLSGAARALGVEHTTAARRIEALEKALGLRLFDRFARGWALTEAGAALLPQARRVEDEMLALQRQASSATEGHGTVRISAPPGIAAHWIAPQWASVRAQLHGIDIELAAEQAHADLARRDADIAIRFRRPNMPDLAVRSVATVQYYLCGHPDYLAAHAQAEWEFIGYDASLANTPQQEWLDALAGTRRFIMRSNDIAAIYSAARTGLGVAVLPDYLAANLIIGAIPCPVQRQLWMVVHADVRKAPRVRRVADLLADLLSRPAR